MDLPSLFTLIAVADLPQRLAESAIWIRPFLAANFFPLVPGAELAEFPEGEGTNASISWFPGPSEVKISPPFGPR